MLTGSGSDPDTQDVLTFTWEEYDIAATSGDPVSGPLFRWRPPTLAPSRAFPALTTVLSGAADPLEKLPNVDRTLHFRLVARDNHAGTGGHAWDDMMVTVSGTPFVVTFPNGANSVPAGPFTVTWSIGGGSVAANVNIRLSTDGGTSWISLAMNTPNDGTEVVTYSTATTRTACRIKVEAAANIFYDVSDTDFTIVGNPAAVLISAETPRRLAITAVTPNPSHGFLRVEYAVPRTGFLRLTLMDVQGRVVATLVNGVLESGRYRTTWSGAVPCGKAQGLYFLNAELDRERAVRRAIITR